MRSTESNLAIVNGQDDGKRTSQVVAEIIFFICQESMDLLSNLGADAFPHQHFITPCRNRCVFPKLGFYKNLLYCKAAAPLSPCHIDFLLWKPAVSSLRYCLWSQGYDIYCSIHQCGEAWRLAAPSICQCLISRKVFSHGDERWYHSMLFFCLLYGV